MRFHQYDVLGDTFTPTPQKGKQDFVLHTKKIKYVLSSKIFFCALKKLYCKSKAISNFLHTISEFCTLSNSFSTFEHFLNASKHTETDHAAVMKLV